MDRKIGVSTKVYGSIHMSHNDDTDISNMRNSFRFTVPKDEFAACRLKQMSRSSTSVEEATPSAAARPLPYCVKRSVQMSRVQQVGTNPTGNYETLREKWAGGGRKGKHDDGIKRAQERENERVSGRERKCVCV